MYCSWKGFDSYLYILNTSPLPYAGHVGGEEDYVSEEDGNHVVTQLEKDTILVAYDSESLRLPQCRTLPFYF